MNISPIQCNSLSGNFSNPFSLRQKESTNFKSVQLQQTSKSISSRIYPNATDDAVDRFCSAIQAWDFDTVKYMIENKLVSPNAKIWGKIPVVRFVCGNSGCYSNSGPAFDIAKYIIGLEDVDINACDDRGNNALLFCCINDDDYLIAEILKRTDVDLSIKNRLGQTASDMANIYTMCEPLQERRFKIRKMLENYQNNKKKDSFNENEVFINSSTNSAFDRSKVNELIQLFANRFDVNKYNEHKADLANFIGISENALDAIFMKNQKVYRKVIAEIYPDTHKELPFANEKTIIVNQIYKS